MCLNSSRLLKSLWTPGIGIQNHLSGQLPWIRSWRNCDGAGKPSKTSSRGAPCRVHEKGGKNNSSRLGDTTLDKEAIAAIEETRQALDAIASSNTAAALAAIERATGKVNILLARNPATPLIPVDAAVEVIDLAPSDHAAIMEIAQDASRAVDERAFSAARLLLHSLMSEIRVRTGNLPLAPIRRP